MAASVGAPTSSIQLSCATGRSVPPGGGEVPDPLTLDGIDRGLVHALHVDGRASFARIAAVLGTSTQTVARRYARLRARGGLRVVGLPDPARAGRQQWIVRLTAAPGAAQAVGRALARRPDTAWVRLTSGGTEIVAIVHTDPRAPGDPHSLLLHDLPRTAAVTAVSAHCLLHLYRGGPTGWPARAAALTQEQQARLRPAPHPVDLRPDPVDDRLLAALQHDGRAPWTELAAATGLSPATARRRVGALRASGALWCWWRPPPGAPTCWPTCSPPRRRRCTPT
jgi:DNA-binding Lrp family transcriptional regulator